jgi:hypothetical protein
MQGTQPQQAVLGVQPQHNVAYSKKAMHSLLLIEKKFEGALPQKCIRREGFYQLADYFQGVARGEYNWQPREMMPSHRRHLMRG